MSQFKLYLDLGFFHILDARGYDHILFVIALCAIYIWSDRKKILILVTAFTVGHSITLALATLDVIRVNSDLVEFLIPLTIFITAVTNILLKKTYSIKEFQANYLFALFFGLIHGLGFSNYLRALLGKDQTIFTQLFAFNIGIELGQIIIVVIFMTISFIFTGIFNVSRRDWNLVISSAVAGIAITMMIDSSLW